MIDPLWLSYSSFSAAFLNFLLFQELLVLLQCSGDFLRHILLVVLSQNFCSFKIAHSTPGLLCDPKLVLLQNHLIRLLHFLRERLNKPLHHHGVAFPEKIRQRSLEFDQNSAEPKLGLGGILSVFGDRIAGGHVENELVLELVEHDDNESRDAAEEAAVAVKWWMTAALVVAAERVRVEAKREMSREAMAICELRFEFCGFGYKNERREFEKSIED
nr:hypothetical protein TorRG33x02_013630 [Ipomoea batatas]